MPEKASKSQRRRVPLFERIECLRALLADGRKRPLSARVRIRARCFGYSERSVWRWLERYREGGANALRDSFRRDAFTRKKSKVRDDR
jgi:transposase